MSNATIGFPSVCNRMEATRHVLDYPQVPISTTLIERTIQPNPSVTNCVVMFYAHGFGQEGRSCGDALTML